MRKSAANHASGLLEQSTAVRSSATSSTIAVLDTMSPPAPHHSSGHQHLLLLCSQRCSSISLPLPPAHSRLTAHSCRRASYNGPSKAFPSKLPLHSPPLRLCVILTPTVGILLLLFNLLASRCTMQRAISLPFLLTWGSPVTHHWSHRHSLQYFRLLEVTHEIATIWVVLRRRRPPTNL